MQETIDLAAVAQSIAANTAEQMRTLGVNAQVAVSIVTASGWMERATAASGDVRHLDRPAAGEGGKRPRSESGEWLDSQCQRALRFIAEKRGGQAKQWEIKNALHNISAVELQTVLDTLVERGKVVRDYVTALRGKPAMRYMVT